LENSKPQTEEAVSKATIGIIAQKSTCDKICRLKQFLFQPVIICSTKLGLGELVLSCSGVVQERVFLGSTISGKEWGVGLTGAEIAEKTRYN
jgi:hypothetical protein